MHLFRTPPLYVVVFGMIFLQMPIFIAKYASGKKYNFTSTHFLSGNSSTVVKNKKTDVVSTIPTKATPVSTNVTTTAKKPVDITVSNTKTDATVIAEEMAKNASTIAATLYQKMNLSTVNLDRNAFTHAIKGYYRLLSKGAIPKKGLLTIVDFSKASNMERFFVLDMAQEKLAIKTLVAHGKNSGSLYANDFSNVPESNKSSLGFYLTLGTYIGKNGYSLHLKGLEKGINDNVFQRAIVVHGAHYVTEKLAKSDTSIGRSLGCPAIPFAQHKTIINTIKDGSVLFLYHPSQQYLSNSKILN